MTTSDIKKKIMEQLKNAPRYNYTCVWCKKPAGCGTRPMEIIHYDCWREYLYLQKAAKNRSNPTSAT